MEHATITQQGNHLHIVPDGGYILYHQPSDRYYNDANVTSLKGWSAVRDGDTPIPPSDPVEAARAAKLAGLEAYDSSEAVNQFFLGEAGLWILPAERTNYLNTIQGAQRLGVESIPFMGVTIPVASAIQMLDAINLYAMQCVGVTDAHRAAINALETVAAIEGYDYTLGYPDKLHFEI